jgi:hypothetical protein
VNGHVLARSALIERRPTSTSYRKPEGRAPERKLRYERCASSRSLQMEPLVSRRIHGDEGPAMFERLATTLSTRRQLIQNPISPRHCKSTNVRYARDVVDSRLHVSERRLKDSCRTGRRRQLGSCTRAAKPSPFLIAIIVCEHGSQGWLKVARS